MCFVPAACGTKCYYLPCAERRLCKKEIKLASRRCAKWNDRWHPAEILLQYWFHSFDMICIRSSNTGEFCRSALFLMQLYDILSELSNNMLRVLCLADFTGFVCATVINWTLSGCSSIAGKLFSCACIAKKFIC